MPVLAPIGCLALSTAVVGFTNRALIFARDLAVGAGLCRGVQHSSRPGQATPLHKNSTLVIGGAAGMALYD